MKNKLTILFILIAFLTGRSMCGQNIDSISVGITKVSHSSDPWKFVAQTVDSFALGLQRTSLFRLWDNNSWLNFRLYEFNYATSVLSEKIVQLWDSLQWINARKWIYNPSPSIDSTITQKWSGAWENDSLTIIYRNTINLDSLVLVQRWKSSSWVDYSKIENTFSPDSTYLSQTISFRDSVLLQWNNYQRFLWLNDSLQRDTAYIEQRYLSGLWENEFGTFYTYDTAGFVNYKLHTHWSSFDSSWSQVYGEYFYTYDSFGRLIFLYVDFIPGGFSNVTYSYDINGNLIDNSEHSESMGGNVTDYNSHWYNFTFPSSPDLFLFINPDFSICSSDSVPIGAFAFGGNYPLHYNWSPAYGLFSDTIDNPFVFADTTTYYIFTVTDNNGDSDFEGVNIEVFKETEITDVQSIPASCLGCGDGKFIVTVSDTSDYILTITPNPGANISNDTISNLPAGIYLICAGNINGCERCVSDTIADGNVGISENVKAKIEVYPNPFNIYTVLRYDNPEKNSELDLLDNYGRLIKTIKITSPVTNITGQDLSPGIYYCIVRTGHTILARLKLIFID